MFYALTVVTANITGADFVTTATAYEGDIAGRPNGNGSVDVFDLVSLGALSASSTRNRQPAANSNAPMSLRF